MPHRNNGLNPRLKRLRDARYARVNDGSGAEPWLRDAKLWFAGVSLAISSVIGILYLLGHVGVFAYESRLSVLESQVKALDANVQKVDSKVELIGGRVDRNSEHIDQRFNELHRAISGLHR